MRRLRAPALAIAHVVALILLRAWRDADDVSQWDLISFLNARSDSLLAVLSRPEVHFRNPFSIPLYNTGAESAVSTLLHTAFGSLSPYFSTLLTLLFYDALFLVLLDRFFRLVLEDDEARTWAWLLVSMSWVTLTFASTQAFMMQPYWVIVLALLGVEYFVQGRGGRGTVCLAVAFLFLSQGHALSFLLPYYAAAYALFRALACRRPRGLRALLTVALFTFVANVASHGAYLRKISPINPYESGNVLANHEALATRAVFFLRQSLWPQVRVDGVRVGFAPYFIYGAAFLLATATAIRRWGRRPLLDLREATALVAGAGLVAFAYSPAFLNPVVKSQRSVPGDLMLVLAVAAGAAALVRRGELGARRVRAILVALALGSDAAYLGLTLRVDHTRNHTPLFDFDLSDGIVRHDMEAAARAMADQLEEEHATLVILYGRGVSENTTDPAMFHARLLRHAGRLTGPDLVFPCHFCDPRYGCPFPDVAGKACAGRCCYDDSRPAVEQALAAGRPVFVWWWTATPRDFSFVSPGWPAESLPGHVLTPVRLAPSVIGWECYRVGAPPDATGKGRP